MSYIILSYLGYVVAVLRLVETSDFPALSRLLGDGKA